MIEPAPLSMDEMIDKLLSRIADGSPYNLRHLIKGLDPSYVVENNKRHSKADQIYSYMIGEDLIDYDPESSFGISSNVTIAHRGTVIVENGGWLQFRQRERLQASQAEKINHLTEQHLEASIFHYKYWWALALVSALGGSILTVLTQIMIRNIRG